MTTDTSITANTVGAGTQAQDLGDGQTGVHDGSATVEGSAGGFRVGADHLTSTEAVGMLFVERAQVFSTLTNDRVKATHEKLKEFKKINYMIEKMRNSQVRSGGHGHATQMDADVVAFCKANNIAMDTTAHDDYHTHQQWDYNITSADGTREKWSDELRVLILKLKASVSNLDSSVTGASSVQEKSEHVAKKVVS